MIKIESIHIEEFRGIRNLTLDMDRKSFVVRGPNGSGKSGVVDAIEFAITGDVSRLRGKGTGGLSVSAHGPHVDRRDYPEAAFVALKVFIPELGKTAVISRRVKEPNKPAYDPDDPDVRRVFAEARAHPEVTLTRREIIKFILAEATRRSKDVQALLRLDSIDQTRATLKTAQNKLGSALSAAESRRAEDEDALRRHLDLETLGTEGVLRIVNEHRALLGLSSLRELGPEVRLDAGVGSAAGEVTGAVEKGAAVRGVGALTDALASLPDASDPAAVAILSDLAELESKPELASALRQRSLVQAGLDLVIDPLCPLCDTAWDLDELLVHLREKLERSREAEEVQGRLHSNAQAIAIEAGRLRSLVDEVAQIARSLGDDTRADSLASWAEDLGTFTKSLRSADDLSPHKERLENGWPASPADLSTEVNEVKGSVEGLPDESQARSAAAFLTRAEDRMSAIRASSEKEVQARRASDASRAVYKAYCDAAEAELGTLYRDVEERFSVYYRRINGTDEGAFEARLEPSQSKLDLSVDFYERGLFPPGAYHSEGHQDGMGVCLYLALMKHLLGDRFTLAVLDDVVMSVDSEHRREFGQLLRTEFPGTQFIITTHDRVWAEQMRSTGLVTAKSTAAFYGWTIDSGPIVEAATTAWEDIAADIEKNNIGEAAATLRRHLEAVSRELAGEVVARPPFRPDNSYDLGDLLPSVVSRMKDILGKAASAAQSWGASDEKAAASVRKKALSKAYAATNAEQWAVNKAVHYNEWANFSREDFEPVVASFSSLVAEFRCSNEDCRTWIYVTPGRGPAESLRCGCGTINFNLRAKK